MRCLVLFEEKVSIRVSHPLSTNLLGPCIIYLYVQPGASWRQALSLQLDGEQLWNDVLPDLLSDSLTVVYGLPKAVPPNICRN